MLTFDIIYPRNHPSLEPCYEEPYDELETVNLSDSLAYSDTTAPTTSSSPTTTPPVQNYSDTGAQTYLRSIATTAPAPPPRPMRKPVLMKPSSQGGGGVSPSLPPLVISNDSLYSQNPLGEIYIYS